MGKPELGQRVQLLRRVSRWRVFLPLFTSHGNAEERIGVERTVSHSILVFGLRVRERKRKTRIARLNAVY